jgi:hypothetical protein
MSDMKVRLIDPKLYYLSLLSKIYNKFIYFTLLRFNYFIIILNYTYFFYLFNCLKDSILFRMNTLSEFTAINYQGSLYEFELIYIILSYKFNIRFILKLYTKKEDLVLSLSNLYININ